MTGFILLVPLLILVSTLVAFNYLDRESSSKVKLLGRFKHAKIYLGVLLLFSILSEITLVILFLLTEFGIIPPFGTGDPGRLYLHALKQEQIFYLVPPMAVEQPTPPFGDGTVEISHQILVTFTPASWADIDGSGDWREPTINVGFKAYGAYFDIFDFYNKFAISHGWILKDPGADPHVINEFTWTKYNRHYHTTFDFELANVGNDPNSANLTVLIIAYAELPQNCWLSCSF